MLHTFRRISKYVLLSPSTTFYKLLGMDAYVGHRPSIVTTKT